MTNSTPAAPSTPPPDATTKLKTEVALEIPAKNIKRLDDPFDRKRYLYEALVPITEAAKIPLGTANPRYQNLNSTVSREIRDSLSESPEMFHQKNRGLWIAADDAEYDNQKGRLFLSFPNQDGALYGVLDGGHTLGNIKQFLEERDPADTRPMPFVTLHIRVGVEDQLPELSATLNRSYQLKEYSIMNANKEFDELKKLLKKKLPFAQIDFQENGAGLYDVVDILQRMALFCKGVFDGDDDKHPIEAYRSKARCLDYFRNNQKEFLALEPILTDCFRLPDQIERILPEVSGSGRFGGYQFAETLKKPIIRQSLEGAVVPNGLDSWSRRHNVSTGVTFPLAASLRVLVKRRSSDGAVLGWRQPPVEFFQKNGAKLFQFIADSKETSPSVLGKDPMFWGKLYHKAYVCLHPED